MRRFLKIFLAAIVCASILIPAGCSQEKDNEFWIGASYFETSKLPEGDTPTDNGWTRLITEKMDFDLKFKFSVPSGTQYLQKINANIAANNTPTAYSVNVNQLPTVIRANMGYDDLAEVYDTYATKLTKKIMGWAEYDEDWNETVEHGLNATPFKIATSGGKLKAIPSTASALDSCPMMFIRADWLKKVNKPVPATIDELEELLIAFKNANLGLDDQGKFCGLGVSDQILMGSIGSISGLFNSFNAYPQIFVGVDSANKITNDDSKINSLDFGYFRPEMGEALSTFQDWYSKGLIFKQFSGTTGTQLIDNVAKGYFGVWLGTMTLPLQKVSSQVAADPTIDWLNVPIPSAISGEQAKVFNPTGQSEFFVLKKGYAHPERLIELINLYTEMLWGENNEFDTYNPITSHFPFKVAPRDKNVSAWRAATESINKDKADFSEWFNNVTQNAIAPWTGDEEAKPSYYSQNSEIQGYYRNVREYLVNGINPTDPRTWSHTRIFYSYEDAKGGLMADRTRTGFDATQGVIAHYLDNGLIYEQKYKGLDTATFITGRASIEEKMKLAVANCIKGGSLDDFWKTVNSLKNNTHDGAGKVLEEVNAAFKQH